MTPPKPPAAPPPPSSRKLTADELHVIDWMEQSKGRKLTEAEINLCLEQARAIGYI
jgi:hypothetical protein